ncbi:hypothetical protein MHUMG1_01038 [Metarhizium humberi]|uniref:ATPase AAA-type core domain-containing protein n=1 Tax=Metarhizium humberi TaxID=2596975 RepID=A0A9P8SBT2_9HYPO|nr:hypothetical protein MHUMG1_01038 [Metarhizium humberi]
MAKTLIVVAGHASIDTLSWKRPGGQKARTGIVDRWGGALLLKRLLKNTLDETFEVRCPEPVDGQNSNRHIHAVVDLVHVPPAKDSDNMHDVRFRVEQLRHAYTEADWPPFGPTLTADKAESGSGSGSRSRSSPDADAARGVHMRLLLLEDSGGGDEETECENELRRLEKHSTSTNSNLKLCELNAKKRLRQAAETKLLKLARPRWLLYKMGPPLATGHLWKTFRKGPYVGEDGDRDPDRVVVVIHANDLRAEGIELSSHLSWEKTSEDFIRQLASNGKLDTLVKCAHLIVLFGCDGVIHYQGRSMEPPILYFDSKYAEGEFLQSCSQAGGMIGLSTAFTAGLAKALATDPESKQSKESKKFKDCIDMGIKIGFAAARFMAKTGFHIRYGGDGLPDYPLIPHNIKLDQYLMDVTIPVEKISSGCPWSILDDIIGAPQEIAYNIVNLGTHEALCGIPIATFKQFKTADRKEIESFRSITNLLQEHWKADQSKPLSIAVFGQPGSGKSFSIMQVAEDAANNRNVKKLPFNLSQFTDVKDLNAAFHLIRDESLFGVTPIVLFDEFDTIFEGKKLGWLRYFLAPMQDGQFLENGQMHPLGPAIFFFIGGTSPTFKDFSKYVDLTPEGDSFPRIKDEQSQFTVAKGPDFISRLRGYVDILGPSQVNEEDRMYPIRRAILLRSLLKQRASHPKDKKILNIDQAVLGAVLSVPKYRHGARSLEMLLAMSKISGLEKFERAALPPEAQLNLHVEAADFMDRVRHPRLPDVLRLKLGEKIHNTYFETRISQAGAKSDPAMKPWESLQDCFKESSCLSADDIPHKLRMVNCYMTAEGNNPRIINGFNKDEIEKLAKREHERYNAERLPWEWELGGEISTIKSPFLAPWEDLEEEDREEEKALHVALVKCIPEIVKYVGYRVCRLGRGPENTPSGPVDEEDNTVADPNI